MRGLLQAIPDADVLMALEPEELAAKLLFVLRKEGGGMFSKHFDNLFNPLGLPGQQGYPRQRQGEVTLALTEAWAWLEAQGLIVPAEGINGVNGFRRFSRRALRMQNEADFASYQTARLLPRDLLHPDLAKPVWLAFMRGEFDVAVFQAMKAVEVAVRDVAGLGNEMLGTKLMRAAFNPENGPLTDLKAEGGERVGRMELFAGAIGSYKNPHSHRDVNLDDPSEAVELILLANHLLRIVDGRAEALRGAP